MNIRNILKKSAKENATTAGGTGGVASKIGTSSKTIHNSNPCVYTVKDILLSLTYYLLLIYQFNQQKKND